MNSARDVFKSYFLTILVAALSAVMFRYFFMEAYKIPNDFMSPTLLPGDHIFLKKSGNRKFGIIGPRVAPRRGDIIIFAFPNDIKKDFMKRVIAVEGDQVEMRDGIVFVNKTPITKAMSSEVPAENSNQEIILNESIEDKKYSVRWQGDSNQLRQVSQAVVPEGQLFLLGDNRSRGQDSRNWGFVPLSFVKGKASFIWFSKSNEGVRWKRLFSTIE